MREIETIREALTALKIMVEAAAGRKIYVPAIEALAILETEIARLRECALDLDKVPEGYVFSRMTIFAGVCRIWLSDPRLSLGDHRSTFEGIGPTPRTALDAAIGRISK